MESMQEKVCDATAILESITDAFFSLNAEWEFTYLNAQAESFVGTSRDYLLGKNIWSVYPALLGTEFEKAYRRAAEQKIATSVTAYYPDHDRWYDLNVYCADFGITVYFRDATERVLATEKLRESERRFRLMADAIPQMVWIADASGRAVFFNQQWSAYTGAPADLMTAEEVAAKFLHPDDRSVTLMQWEQARREGHIFTNEHRIRSAAGEYRWFLVRAEPYRDPHTGEIVQWFGTSTDVHDHKMAEAALKKSEERYRSLFESIDEGFCIIEMLYDENGNPVDYRFNEVNPMFGKQSGMDGVAGKTMCELVPKHEKHWFDVYGKVALTGEAIRFESEAKGLNRWFDVFAFRIDEPGEKKVAVLFKDITTQKSVEAALRDSERAALEAARQAEAERYRVDALLDAVPVGIVVSDTRGAILMANVAHRDLWGQDAPAISGTESFDAWTGWWADGLERHGQRVQAHEWPTARLLRGVESVHDIIKIRSFHAPPLYRTVLISGVPIKDGDDRIVGAVVAQMDITERVKAEDALRQADRRKDEFLAMLAHELRNPLAPISAAADLLRLGRLDESRVKQTSAIISRQVAHMTGLVDDLLDVSRVTRGLVQLNRTRLDAKRIVADAVEQIRPVLEARGHRLTVHTPPAAALVMGDQKRLVQVMTNLLNNACKYTPEGGEIDLAVEVDGAWVTLTVTDNGIGMSPELVERSFELFVQAERASDRSQGGLGIGLALVKSLMELHGGSVTASSEGIGKGSRFTVSLPHLEERVGGPRKELHAATGVTPALALKVMVVDDNPDAAYMLAMLVETLGHEVFVEHGSRRAIERAKIEKPAVCFLDIGLPDMDGNELARCLRAQHETAETILVAVTGYGQEQDRFNAINAGFDHHFVKPVDSAGLEDLLGKISAGRHSPV